MEIFKLLRGDNWIWCLCCERFFQLKDIKRDPEGKDRCCFEDCDGIGFGIDLFSWDDWSEDIVDIVAGKNHIRKSWWPKNTSELVKGLHCPASLCGTNKVKFREGHSRVIPKWKR